MSGILRVSEAASLALHAMYALALDGDRQKSVREIASDLGASGNHLSKVLQELTRAGLVKSVRGPTGGFLLARKPSEITLLEVYESVHGKVVPTTCLLKNPVCKGRCLMGSLLHSVDQQVFSHLQKSTLSDYLTPDPGSERSRKAGSKKKNSVTSTDKSQ